LPDGRVAVFSDIHIGNKTNTCWYQARVHEPYLVAALNWVAQNAGLFQEVILLGDLVDTWTYPPEMTPPSMADIIAANPNVLGSNGALAGVVKAVPKVTYLLGNHDGTLTPADISALQSSVGPIELVDPVHVLTGASGKRTVFSHGHYWTMFNAPDDRAPSGDSLPVGHFVTRAFSYMMAQRLATQPDKTVADEPNMGYPNGFNLWDLVDSIARNPSGVGDIAAMLLNYVANVSGLDESTSIKLPNGNETTIEAAKGTYKDLFTLWVQKENGSIQNAARAALADGSGDHLAWFAQRLAIQQSADLVVMGHTHTPIAGLAISPINYYNSGFECASVPDNPTRALFTFDVVDLESATDATMMVSQGSYAISPASTGSRQSAIVSPGIDYSSYIRILNRSGQPLTLTGQNVTQGYWAVPPPQTIPAGGRGDAWLQDHPWLLDGSLIPHGTEGTFTYQGAGAFKVACPTDWWNDASGAGGNFVVRTGAGDWDSRGSVPWTGHPLQVIFTVGG
jgi:UDP-2,3-diacylglucosamine pyrophosphatase LpxH